MRYVKTEYDADHDCLGEYITSDGIKVSLIKRANSTFESYGYVAVDGLYKNHRVGGPSFHVIASGFISWDIEGFDYKYVEPYCMACGFDEEETLIWVLKYGDYLPYHASKL